MSHTRCGWINDADPGNPAGVVSFQNNAGFFNVIHPHFYVIDSTFALQRTSQDPNHLIERAAQAAGTALWPYISGPDDTDGFGQLLNDGTRRMDHVNALVEELRNPAYAGFEIDYEHLDNRYHDGFRQFLRELTDRAHSLGKQISVTVGAWNSEQAGAADYVNSCYNYNELLNIVDLIHPQFYDFHRVTDGRGHLGPVAPLGWVDNALQVVVETGEPQRFIYGMPNYGLTARVISGDPDPTVQRDPDRQERLQYGFDSLNRLRGQCDPSTFQTTTDHMRAPCPDQVRDHIPPPCCAYENPDQNFPAGRQPNCRQAADPSTLQFFDDLDSLEERLRLAHDRGLGGVAYYAVGDELPGFFDMVRRYFGEPAIGGTRTFSLVLGGSQGPSLGTATMDVDLGAPVPFVAWGAITWIDPRSAITGVDFISAEISAIDGVPTGIVNDLSGLEPPSDPVRRAAVAATGRTITLRLRSIPFSGGGQLVGGAEFVVITSATQ